MKILDKIITKNLKRKGNHILAISLSLLDVLLEKSKYEAQLTSMSLSVTKDGFVSISKIPEDIREFLSLTYIATESIAEEVLGNLNDRFADRFDFLTEHFVNDNRRRGVGHRKVLFELEQAFRCYDHYKCEFIDAFEDERLVNIKAQRLSVLMVLRKMMNEKSLLEAAYSKLQKLDPEFELVSSGMREFYHQLDWYSRTGEVRGCIIA